MHYLNQTLAFITHHSGLAYGAIFLISLSESLALFGLLVPGTIIMFGVGAIVATGSLQLAPALLLAIAGAIAGDGFSYWLGHHYRERMEKLWPFSSFPKMLNKGKTFFHRNGGKSVLFGRFVGPVRPVIPVVAGMLGMGPVHFSIVNVFSAVGWAFVYILPGVFFGASLAMAGTVSTRLAVIILIFATGIWAFIWFCRRIVSLFELKGSAWVAALKHWATMATPVHGSVRPLKRFFSFLLVSKQGEELLFAFLALILFVAGWGFLGVLQDVLAKDPLVVADQAVYNFLQSLRTSWVDNIFVAVTELGDSFVNISLIFAVLLVLLVKRCHRAAGFWTLTAIGGVVGVVLLKWAVHLPRPVSIYHGAYSYGFPSGHTTMSVVLYGFLAILLARKLSGAWRWGLFSSVVSISFIIGLSRLYLGAHWLSDVLGGYFIGAGWAALMGISYLKGAEKSVPRRLLGLTVVLVFLAVGGWHVTQRHEKDLAFYAPHKTVKTVSADAWRSDAWRDLPTRRIDLEGELEQPLTVQWAGSLDELTRFLTAKGWQHPSTLTLQRFFGIFASNTPVETLPVLPQLHDGRMEGLLLVQMERERRLVLRLWPADVNIDRTGSPLFLGTVVEQRRYQFANLITAAKDTGEYELSLKALKKTLNGRFSVTQVNRTGERTAGDREHGHLSWRGDVLLIMSNNA
jgi:undecaprenyl-diphosphatase